MHETPKGADPSSQDRDRQQGMDRQQNRQNRDQGDSNRNAGEGASGMQDGEASGAGYGNNAGSQDSEGERGR